MAPESAAPPSEFRPYRRFVSWFVLTFVSIGSAFLLVSVGVTIYRRRHAVPAEAPIALLASAADLEECHEKLTDVEQGLERHLESFHHLIAHYDPVEAQRWAQDEFWPAQWRAAGEHCQFTQPRPGRWVREWEQLGVIFNDLRETEESYSKELVRFGRNQAPRLDRIREQLEKVGKRIHAADPQESGEKTPPRASADSGESP